MVCLLVGCLTSQQHASVSQGWIYSDNFTCCHTEIRSCRSNFPSHPVTVYWHRANQSPSTDPILPGAWQGGHWSANFLSYWYDSTPEKSRCKQDSNPGSSALEADALTTMPTRQSQLNGKKPRYHTTQDRRHERHLKLQAYQSVLGTHREIFLDRHLPSSLKRKVFNQCVLPAMTYRCRTWSLTKALVRKLWNKPWKVKCLMSS